MRVALVTTGLANVASVTAALVRLGVEPLLTRDADAVRTAEGVVLPGVGALGPAARRFAETGLDEALVERVEAGRPTLAICLGLQLLCRASDEAPGVRALGLADGEVRRMDAAPRLPHFGWNRVAPEAGCSLLEPGDAYFAHSYALDEVPAGWSGARTTHGAPFVSALERGDVLACQFHPELSGAYGARLLGRWLARVAAREVAPC